MEGLITPHKASRPKWTWQAHINGVENMRPEDWLSYSESQMGTFHRL